ncbi:MAG: aspartate aminotransferase family protein [Chloroflexi bacterium]|nr:aspartate aminotransferase family protein [Chloroflexota bacterium]
MRYTHPHGHVFYRKMDFARPKISHGEGIYLFDDTGKRYIDGSGGALVVNVGHGRSAIAHAIAQQTQAVAYAHATMFTSEPAEQFSEALAQVVPVPDARFFYMSSGSEVVEGAIKLARQIQMARGENGRTLTVSRWRSYHGLSFGALAASGRPGFRKPYLGMMRDIPHIEPPYPYRDPVSGMEAANRLEQVILQYGASNIGAFIAEPISGASLGAVAPLDDYWPRIREICDQYGVLLIADEVLVGMGRTGKWWGIDHWDIQPDILVSSKGLAGGYWPLGCIAAKGEDVSLIREKLGDFNHGGTFSHHAVGTAVGLEVLRIMQDEKLVANAAVVGEYMGQKLRHAFSEHPNIGDIRGRGLFWGLELVQNRETKEPFPASQHLAPDIWKRAFESGLIIYYSQGCVDGVNGDLIMLGPPLIASQGDVDEMVEILETAVRAKLSS